MTSTGEDSLIVLVRRVREGDVEAREDLAGRIYQRIIQLARRMMRSSPHAVRRWEQTDDLVHAAWIRIERMLQDDSVQPNDEAHLLRLAARHIRFELIDMYRRHTGAQGIHANHQSVAERPEADTRSPASPWDPAADTCDPARLAAWAELHRQIEALPEREQAVVELIWYQGLTQAEVAELLSVDVRTVKRAWRSGRLQLAQSLEFELLD